MCGKLITALLRLSHFQDLPVKFLASGPKPELQTWGGKAMGFPHPLGTEYATLSQQSCGVFTPNPSLCYNLESRTSGKNYKLITMLFLLTEKGMVEQKRPQNSSSYPKLQHIYHLPFWSISGAQKWLFLSVLSSFVLILLRKRITCHPDIAINGSDLGYPFYIS